MDANLAIDIRPGAVEIRDTRFHEVIDSFPCGSEPEVWEAINVLRSDFRVSEGDACTACWRALEVLSV